jgi:HAD superfamily hydrolase (TIGR01509 family)
MNDMTAELLILDCDGVLIRSELANLAYYNHLLEHFGYPAVKIEEREKVSLFHTLSTPQVIERFFAENERKDVSLYTKELEYSKFIGMLTVEPGWDVVLPELARTMRVCVATNRGHSVHELLGKFGLTNWIEKIFNVHDVARAKPAPDLLNAALGHFGVSASQSIYVGDSALDHCAAGEAGVPFIGYRFEQCDRWVSDVFELQKLLLHKTA